MTLPDDSGSRLQVGDPAPSFRLATLDGGTTTLEDLGAGRHLVLLFMREFT